MTEQSTKTSDDPSDSASCSLAVTKPCCDVWLKSLGVFNWYVVVGVGMPDRLVMPNIKTISADGGHVSWRVNNCPSCGAVVRDAVIAPETLEASRDDIMAVMW